MGQKPLDPGLFTWPSNDPRLIGGRHKETGHIVFPKPLGDERYEEVLLGNRGTLWTYTIQRFIPKSPPYIREETPESFTPYAVGYVELPGEVRVETRLTGVAPEDIEIGMEMELTIEPFHTDTAGDQVLTYMFRPAN